MTNSINSLQNNLWKWLSISFGAIILIYGVLRIVPIMRGVNIETYLPKESDITGNSFTLSGVADHARRLSINGRQILIDPSGAFSDEVILAPGMNKIKIVAEDVRGNIHTKEIIMSGTEWVKEIKTAKAESEEIQPIGEEEETVTN